MALKKHPSSRKAVSRLYRRKKEGGGGALLWKWEPFIVLKKEGGGRCLYRPGKGKRKGGKENN